MKRLLPSHPTAATAMQCILSPNEEGGHVGRQWRLMRDSRCEGEAALASHDHPTIRVASLLLILYPFGSLPILAYQLSQVLEMLSLIRIPYVC